MVLPPEYPSGIVDYNKLRFLTPDAVDATNVQTFAVQMPRDFTRYFFGAFSLLQDVSSWRKVGALSEEDLVDIANNEVTFMPICEVVADCIESDGATLQAIVNLFGSSDVAQQAIQDVMARQGYLPVSMSNSPDDYNLRDESVLVTGCSLDAVYGQCVAIEDYIAQVSQDFIEVVSNAPGTVAAIARAIDTIPILGDLPVADDLNDIVTWLQIQGVSTFDAGYTTTVRQNNICALWERACTSCELTTRDILATYTNGGAIAYAFNDPLRLLAQAVVGNVAPTAFAYAVQSFVAGCLAVGSEVFGLLGLRGLQTIAASGEPDGDHALFCNPCPPPPPPTCQLPCTPSAFTNIGLGSTISGVSSFGGQGSVFPSGYRVWSTGSFFEITAPSAICWQGIGSQWARFNSTAGISFFVDGFLVHTENFSGIPSSGVVGTKNVIFGDIREGTVLRAEVFGGTMLLRNYTVNECV